MKIALAERNIEEEHSTVKFPEAVLRRSPKRGLLKGDVCVGKEDTMGRTPLKMRCPKGPI